MALKKNVPISTMPVGNPVKVGTAMPVDPSTNPILIKEFSPQPDPVPRTPVLAPTTGGTRIPQTGGGRSGIGRLQKVGMPGVPSTPVDMTAVVLTHLLNRPRIGGKLPPQTRTVPKTGGSLPPKSRPSGGYDGSGINPGAGKPRAGNIRDRMMSRLGRGRKP